MKLLYKTELKRFLKKTKINFPLKRELVFFLYAVEYPANVGSIFRLADACGVKEVYLAGITPDPVTPKIKKIARYKIRSIRWKQVKNVELTFNQLRKRGFSISALEVTDESEIYSKSNFPNKVCLVVGNEDHGIPNKILNECDNSIFIPMYGKGKSLNVHVALSVVAYHLLV